jgi:hypothetical protein
VRRTVFRFAAGDWDITQNFKILDDLAMVGALSRVREKTNVR